MLSGMTNKQSQRDLEREKLREQLLAKQASLTVEAAASALRGPPSPRFARADEMTARKKSLVRNCLSSPEFPEEQLKVGRHLAGISDDRPGSINNKPKGGSVDEYHHGCHHSNPAVHADQHHHGPHHTGHPTGHQEHGHGHNNGKH